MVRLEECGLDTGPCLLQRREPTSVTPASSLSLSLTHTLLAHPSCWPLPFPQTHSVLSHHRTFACAVLEMSEALFYAFLSPFMWSSLILLFLAQTSLPPGSLL